MATSSQDGDFEEDQDPADMPAGSDDAPEVLEPTKPQNFVHIDDIKAEAERKDQQRTADGKMSLRRYQEIFDAKKAGVEIELSDAEQSQYEEAGRHIQETFQNVGKAFSKQFEQINNKISETIMRNAGIQKSFADSFKPTSSQSETKVPRHPAVDPPSIKSTYHPGAIPVIPTPDYAAMSDSANQANRDRAKRETADRQVAAEHLEATRAMAKAIQDQAAASEQMSKHQKKMNWWILGATLAGVSAAILFGLFGG